MPIISKLCSFLPKILTYCVYIRMLLHQEYILIMYSIYYIDSNINFRCSKLIDTKSYETNKVLFYVIKGWYYLEYFFNLSKLTILYLLERFIRIDCRIQYSKTNLTRLLFYNSLVKNTYFRNTTVFDRCFSFYTVTPW